MSGSRKRRSWWRFEHALNQAKELIRLIGLIELIKQVGSRPRRRSRPRPSILFAALQASATGFRLVEQNPAPDAQFSNRTTTASAV